jgi:hypothetical protein
LEKNEISKLHEEWKISHFQMHFTFPNAGARFKKPERKLSKGFSQTPFNPAFHLFGLM